jgi:hypothetical protein
MTSDVMDLIQVIGGDFGVADQCLDFLGRIGRKLRQFVHCAMTAKPLPASDVLKRSLKRWLLGLKSVPVIGA